VVHDSEVCASSRSSQGEIMTAAAGSATPAARAAAITDSTCVCIHCESQCHLHVCVCVCACVCAYEGDIMTAMEWRWLVGSIKL